MARFVNHSICQPCFSFRNPGRVPVRISMPLMFCCACGVITNDGILVRGEWTAEANCRCVDEVDPELHPQAVIDAAADENDGTVVNWACALGERKPIFRKESIVYASGCQACVVLHHAHTEMFTKPLKSVGYERDGSLADYDEVVRDGFGGR